MEFLKDNDVFPRETNTAPANNANFIAVLGAKGSGKTLYTTALLASIVDGAVEGVVGTVSQSTHEFLSRHLLPMRQARKWPEPTRGWHDLSLSLRWELPEEKFLDYKLSFQDIQGSDFETLTPQLIEGMRAADAYIFIVSPKHLLTRQELVEAAGENAYLESIIPEEERFARQVNWNYSQALEQIITKSKEEGQKTSRPIAVVFTRKDDYPNLDIKFLKAKFLGAFKWFKAHARYVDFFFVSSVGKTVSPDPEQDAETRQLFEAQYGKFDFDMPAKKSPPAEIEPEGVVDPLRFVLEAFAYEKERRWRIWLRRLSAYVIAACVLFLLFWGGNWGYSFYLKLKTRTESAQFLNDYIDKNPAQTLEVYQKISQYIEEYGNDHEQGRKFSSLQARLAPQVREKWFSDVLIQAQECDSDGKSVSSYQKACHLVEDYLKSEFPEGKERLRDLLQRLQKRKLLAQTLEEVKNSQEHGDYRFALASLEKYLDSYTFQRSLVLEKYEKLRKIFSSTLLQQAMEQAALFRHPGKYEEGALRLEVFARKEKPYLEAQDAAKLAEQTQNFQSKHALEQSEKAFEQRNYREARRILENFLKHDRLSEETKGSIEEQLKALSDKEYENELKICLALNGTTSLDALVKFQDDYANHPRYSKGSFSETVCAVLREIAREIEQSSRWEEGLEIFSLQEQRFPDLATHPLFWQIFLPLLYGRIWKLADQGDYQNAWMLWKSYQVKLSGQLKLKKLADELHEWAKKLAQLELENNWKMVLLVQKPQEAVHALEKFRGYQNQPFFSDIYRSKYHAKVEEKRFQLCLKQYQTALAKSDFQQTRLILEQYEGWGSEDIARINELREAVDKQEIRDLWQTCLTKIGTGFLAASLKIEAVETFQRHNREQPGYKYIEEEVEIFLRTLKNKLKEDRENQLQRQIAYVFDDEAALPKAQELFAEYQKYYPADKNVSRFQAQIHQAQINWGKRRLQECGDSYKPSVRYEAYERFIRRHASKSYLYRDLLQQAEKLKEDAAQEWDRQEFQKADAAWREFSHRGDEYAPQEGRKRLAELIALYQNYTKHWGPKKNFVSEAGEQMLFLKQLLNGAKYTVQLVTGEFAENYWVYNPSAEVVVAIGDTSYPYKVYKDAQKVSWKEDKEFSWKAYQPVTLVVVDRDKKKDNELLTHSETGFLSLFKFCTSEDKEGRILPFREIANADNKITFALVGSTVSQVNQKYGVPGKTDTDGE